MSLYEIQDNTLRLKPHWGQYEAWASESRFTFIIAGTQSGKTSFLPHWLNREINTIGSGDYLAVTASYDLFKLKLLPEMRNVFENLLRIGRYWASERVIEIKDPIEGFKAKRSDDPMYARIILRSAESKGGLESATANAAILDECGQDSFTLEDWEAILRRLSLSQGRVLGATTPYNLGWLKSKVYDAWKSGDKNYNIIQFPSIINPMFPQVEYERAKSEMQQWRFDMFYRGIFTRPAGLIYTQYNDKILCDPFEIPSDWHRVIGIDFGGANTATVHLAENEGKWYIYRETLEGYLTTREHVEIQLNYLDGVDSYDFVGGAKSEIQQRDDWHDAGIYVEEPIISDVESGIDKVSQLLAEDRLRIFRDLSGIQDEFGSYRRRLDDLGNPVDEILNKRHFHRLDALRYAAILIVEGVGVTVGGGRK